MTAHDGPGSVVGDARKRLAEQFAVEQLDVAAIRARVEGATEGPWVCNTSCYVVSTMPGEWVTVTRRGRDTEFIAAARTDVPALCDEVERLRDELARHRKATVDVINGACETAQADLAAARATIARVRTVVDQYFDLDVDSWDEGACPEPEDVWRFHRDLLAALTAPTTDGGVSRAATTPDQQGEGES